MTLPDTGPERPGGLASSTRQMAEDDALDAVRGKGPAGVVVLVVIAAVVIGTMAWLLFR